MLFLNLCDVFFLLTERLPHGAISLLRHGSFSDDMPETRETDERGMLAGSLD
jgi:hypothetical protein